MATKISATDLAKRLSDVLNRVRYRGETFIVERNGELVASLAPPGPPAIISLREAAARLGDLALPGEGFAEDVEDVQAAQPRVGAPPWHS